METTGGCRPIGERVRLVASLPLLFGSLVAGAIVIDYGVKHTRAAFSDTSSPSSSTATATVGAVNPGNASSLAAGTPLTGSNANAWAAAILDAIHAPATQANISSLLAWFGHEGGGGANNPLNTTLQTAGATGSINSVGVKSYASPADGIAATAQTLTHGYPAIVGALQAGGGLLHTAGAVADELLTWSGGGYSSL